MYLISTINHCCWGYIHKRDGAAGLPLRSCRAPEVDSCRRGAQSKILTTFLLPKKMTVGLSQV